MGDGKDVFNIFDEDDNIRWKLETTNLSYFLLAIVPQNIHTGVYIA